jgi:hypothetical protein
MADNAISRQAAAQNVGTGERVVSSLVGAALIWRALARPSLARIVAGLGGAALLQRGWTGHCPLYQRLGIDTGPHRIPQSRRDVACSDSQGDPVQCASEDSFPASDPPAWTPVAGSVARR